MDSPSAGDGPSLLQSSGDRGSPSGEGLALRQLFEQRELQPGRRLEPRVERVPRRLDRLGDQRRAALDQARAWPRRCPAPGTRPGRGRRPAARPRPRRSTPRAAGPRAPASRGRRRGSSPGGRARGTRRAPAGRARRGRRRSASSKSGAVTTSRISSTPSAIGTTSSHVGRRRRESIGPGSGSVASGPSPAAHGYGRWVAASVPRRRAARPSRVSDRDRLAQALEHRLLDRPRREARRPTARTSNEAPSATAASSSLSNESSGVWPWASTSAATSSTTTASPVSTSWRNTADESAPYRRSVGRMSTWARRALARHRVPHVLLDPLPGHRARRPRASPDGRWPASIVATPRPVQSERKSATTTWPSGTTRVPG